MKLLRIVFSIFLTFFIVTTFFLTSCSKDKDDKNPVSPTETPPPAGPTPPGASWSTLFSADFNGSDGVLVGDWDMMASASNFNNMARGQGGQGGGLGICNNLNVSNKSEIKITAIVSNFPTTMNSNSAILLARLSGEESGYLGVFTLSAMTIMTLSSLGPGEIVPSVGYAPLDPAKWYIIEFQLKLTGSANLQITIKDGQSQAVIESFATTHNTINGPGCGFGLESPMTDYLYLDNFKVEEYK